MKWVIVSNIDVSGVIVPSIAVCHSHDEMLSKRRKQLKTYFPDEVHVFRIDGGKVFRVKFSVKQDDLMERAEDAPKSCGTCADTACKARGILVPKDAKCADYQPPQSTPVPKSCGTCEEFANTEGRCCMCGDSRLRLHRVAAPQKIAAPVQKNLTPAQIAERSSKATSAWWKKQKEAGLSSFPRSCSICHESGHYKTTCPKKL